MVRRLAVCAVMCALVLGMTMPASAGLWAQRLNGGVGNRHYWINPNALNLSVYQPIIRNAVSSWNNTPTRILFSETTNDSASAADFYVNDYGNTQWDGVMVAFHSDGSLATACTTCGPNSNWDYSELSMNWYYQSSYTTLERQSVAAHEFGHGVALGHTSVRSALMYPDTGVRYVQNGTYTPQQNDDITWASQLQ